VNTSTVPKMTQLVPAGNVGYVYYWDRTAFVFMLL